MFQFPGFALPDLCIQSGVTLAGRVSPFRYLRIKACCQLPVAFRRLPRLSSPVIAKASTTCTYSLDPITLSPQSFQTKAVTSFVSLSRVCAICIRLECKRLLIQSKPMFFMHPHLGAINPAPTRLRESLSLLLPNF